MPERLYYADPWLASFEAEVVDIREASRSEGRSLWQVALDRSAFYPTSGGQPYDTGMLTAVSQGGALLEAPVVAVEEDGQGEVWHTTPKPLLAGTMVRGHIDWRRRRDHMQQHSGQHLLSAVVYGQLAAATVSFHLGETASTIDLVCAALTPEDLDRVEDKVNEIIAEDRPIRIRTVPRPEAEQMLTAGALTKLPDRPGDIRLIEIEDIDLNACGGTHLRSTGQIGGLLLRGVERVRQGIRVEFVCGLRAVASARQDLAALTRAGAALSVGRLEVPEGIERLVAAGKAAHKASQRLTEELAGYHAASLLQEQPARSCPLVRRSFSDRDGAYVKLLASRIIAQSPGSVALVASAQEEPARVFLAAGADVKLDCGALLRQSLAAYGVRGGGSPSMAQGQIARDHLESLLDQLQASVQAAQSGGQENALE